MKHCWCGARGREGEEVKQFVKLSCQPLHGGILPLQKWIYCFWCTTIERNFFLRLWKKWMKTFHEVYDYIKIGDILRNSFLDRIQFEKWVLLGSGLSEYNTDGLSPKFSADIISRKPYCISVFLRSISQLWSYDGDWVLEKFSAGLVSLPLKLAQNFSSGETIWEIVCTLTSIKGSQPVPKLMIFCSRNITLLWSNVRTVLATNIARIANAVQCHN